MKSKSPALLVFPPLLPSKAGPPEAGPPPPAAQAPSGEGPKGRVWDPPLHTVGRDVGGKCARPELAGDAPSSVWPSASHLPPEGEGKGRGVASHKIWYPPEIPAPNGKKIAKRELTGHFGIGYNIICIVWTSMV